MTEKRERLSDESRLNWIKYELRYYYRKFAEEKVFLPKPSYDLYAQYKVMGMVETNKFIYDIIKSGEAYAIGRIGGNEMNNIAYYSRNILFPYRTNACKDVFHDLNVQAGFFPESIELQKDYVDLMLNDIADINVLGIWNRYMEEWVIDRYGKSIDTLTKLIYLEPMRLEESDPNAIPWSAALEGKRVLVVHPFKESIEKQYYNNREHIFEGIHVRNILPKFDLYVVKAVQSLSDERENYKDWFDALEYMKCEIDKLDYDVAIIGCGAYGLPLAAHVKRKGKIAIHMGGATQLLFGIRGKRWDLGGTRDYYYMNSYWVRPMESERIKNMSVVEGGCYW